MTTAHRRWHRWMWLALAPLLAGGVLVALAARPLAPSVTSEEIRR